MAVGGEVTHVRLSTCQAEYVRIPNAHGTLVATPEHPADDFLPSLLALSDVMGTGWFAAQAAQVGPGSTDIVTERGEEGIARVKDLTDGVGSTSSRAASTRARSST